MNKTTLIAAVATAYATAVTASLASTNTASLGGMVLASAGGRKPPLDPAGKSGRFFPLTVSEGRDSMANRARIPLCGAAALDTILKIRLRQECRRKRGGPGPARNQRPRGHATARLFAAGHQALRRKNRHARTCSESIGSAFHWRKELIMNFPTEPPQLVKVLTGVAAIITILLSGVTLGVLTGTGSIDPIQHSVASMRPLDPQPGEDGLIQPVLRLGASKREAPGTMTACRTREGVDFSPDARCQNPVNPDMKKLLVLLALWRKTS